MLVLKVLKASEGHEGLGAYEGYLCAVNRILLQEREQLTFIPNKLSAAMIGAFKAMGGSVVDSVETGYAQWQQYAGCAMQAVARRSLATRAKPLAVTLILALRRVKAFFISQKVNGRNAP